MFVKKDLRKIPVILQDAMPNTTRATNNNDDNDTNQPEPLTKLRLDRRPTEFKMTTIATNNTNSNNNTKNNNPIETLLCQPRYIPALRNLTSLSLYDCQLSNMNGIGFFASKVSDYKTTSLTSSTTRSNENKNDDSMDVDVHMEMDMDTSNDIICPNLSEINLGRNPITSIPTDIKLLCNSLTSLWLDDCQIKGSLPECLYELTNLEMLRLSNNYITELKDDDKVGVGRWKNMKVLSLDGNQMERIPKSFVKLTKLKSLLLRLVIFCCLASCVLCLVLYHHQTHNIGFIQYTFKLARCFL